LVLGVFSFDCLLAAPVTTSYIVGRLFIMLKSRLLEQKIKQHENEVLKGLQVSPA
jgi:hypothetical protein